MAENNGAAVAHPSLEGVNSSRLFWGSCISLISTSVAFGVVTGIMGALRDGFQLTNAQAGWIGGATLWGFTISIFVFGPLVDVLGMGRLMRFAMLCHFVGPLLMIFAQGFWTLFLGGLIISLGNGTVEAVCNPLVATIYPDQKVKKLNQFHVWFPGGIVIGGLASFFLSSLGEETFWASKAVASWQVKIALVLIPTVIYGIIFTGQKFPVTERVQSGLSFGDMVRALFRPLFIILILCMSITASIELGPGRWMGEAMSSSVKKVFEGIGDGAGILVLVYGSTLMAVLRFFAGPIVHRFSPSGLLVFSAVMGGCGLYAMTYAEGFAMLLLTATMFYVGVCYFWPTMLGVTAERVPKGGSMALALMGGWGMAVVGLVTAPFMGVIVDGKVSTEIQAQEAEVAAVIQSGSTALKSVTIEGREKDIEFVEGLAAALAKGEAVEPVDSAKALRTITDLSKSEEVKVDTATGVALAPVAEKAEAIIAPADDAGQKKSFRTVAMFAIVIAIVFGSIFIKDRAGGGYKVESIHD